MKKEALRAAFPQTAPVMIGYISMGVAFGILLSSKGYHFGWALLMSLSIYAGAMQFVAIDLLAPGFRLLQIAFLTLMVNARHIFYGLSLIEKFRTLGREKGYMIFALTDETYSLLCAKEPPEGVDRRAFYFFICLLDHSYWILGCTLGALIGTYLHFNTTGIDFVMTALFVVLLIDLWRETKNHRSAVVGLGASLLCLVLFGPDHFLLPAMGCILLLLTFGGKSRKNSEDRQEVDPC